MTPNPYRAHWRLRMVASDEAVERVEEGMLEAFLLSELPLEEARPSIARHHLVSVNCHNDISSLDPPGSSRLTWFVDGPPVWSFGFQVEGVSQLLVVATGSLRGNYHRDEVNQNAHWLAKIREGVDVMESIKSYFGVA